MATATQTRPAINRDGQWIIYHRRTGAVEEHPPEEARQRLSAGIHVVRPGGRVSDWDPGPQWTLRTSPEAYLGRYPEGPNADLAREVLGLAEPDGEDAPEAEEPGDPGEPEEDGGGE